MISQKDFNKTITTYSKLENRGSFYPMFLKMIKKGFKTEAFLFILATWNFALFRFAIKDFNINKFQKTVKSLEPYFKKFQNKKFSSINFDDYKKDINKIFTTLYKIKGIQSTGTSKIMHLACPNVFVMWDSFIKKRYGFKRGDAKDYLDFLKVMQDEFKDIKWTNKSITFAKAIDQYNYCRFTQSELEKNKTKVE
jgi:hypothetical protein